MASETDSRGIETRYYYNSKTGYLLATINKTEGTGTAYTYDALGNITSVMPATFTSDTSYSSVGNAEKVNYTYDSVNMLDTIVTRSSTYSFNYDVFGNTTDISVGNRELAGYTYNPNNGKLATMTYGNGTTVRYVYDELDNVKEIWYNTGGTETKAYEYIYTSYGQLARFDNLITGKTTIYRYNGARQLVNTVEYDTDDMKNKFASNMDYDENHRLHSLYYVLNYTQSTSSAENITAYNYYYTPDGDLDSVSLYANVNDYFVDGEIEYSYDTFKRLTGRTYSFGTYTNSLSYSYKAGAESNSTTALVNTYTSTVNGTSTAYSYIYDNNGNITHIYINGTLKYRYEYDDLGQLVREDFVDNNCTYTYSYDNAGNLLTIKMYYFTDEGVEPTNIRATYAYGYSDDTWGDLLTSYGGQTITYDAIGNPLSYYNGSSYTKDKASPSRD